MSGLAPDSHSLTQYKKLYILFLRYVHQRLPCLPTGWNSSFSVFRIVGFFFAQPKPHANPSFLLFVTLPTLAQETQNLKIQGLTPSK